jgi:hypothetical protein
MITANLGNPVLEVAAHQSLLRRLAPKREDTNIANRSRQAAIEFSWGDMMLYAVSAKLIADRAAKLKTRLLDGSIAAQRPDGAEIVAAMKRARVAADGTVRWTETCYCPTPLQHERATVLDEHFTDIETSTTLAEF